MRAKLESSGPVANVTFQVTLGQGPKFARGIVKIAFSIFAFHHYNEALDIRYDPIRSFVTEGVGVRKIIWMHAPNSIFKNEARVPFRHESGDYIAISFRLLALDFIVDLSPDMRLIKGFKNTAHRCTDQSAGVGSLYNCNKVHRSEICSVLEGNVTENPLTIVKGAAQISALLTKVYGDLAKPDVRQIGAAIGTILGLGNTLLWPAILLNERAKIALTTNLEKYSERLREIPEDKIVSVPPEIGVPIAEKLAYVTNEELSDLSCPTFQPRASSPALRRGRASRDLSGYVSKPLTMDERVQCLFDDWARESKLLERARRAAVSPRTL